MLTILSLILVQFGDEPAASRQIQGRCFYPESVIERAQGTTLITCSEAIVADDSISFAARGWEPTIRFSGDWDGERMTVRRITRRGRESAEEARGLCQIYYADERLSTIACTAVVGGRSYAANFVVARI